MGKIKNYFSQIFMHGVDERRLDAFRIVFAIPAIIFFLRLPFEYAADFPICAWSPPGAAAFILSGSLSFAAITFLKITFVVSMLALAAGIFARISAAIAAISLYLVLANSVSAYYFDRSGNVLLLTLVVLALSPNLGQKFAVLPTRRSTPANQPSDSIWPARLIQFLFFSIFFAAGLSKFIHSGLSWADADNLIAKWIWAGQSFDSHVVLGLQRTVHDYLIQQRQLAGVLGLAVMLLESSALIFFVFPRFGAAGAILMATLQVGVLFTMYISFNLFLPMYLIFVPFEKLFKSNRFFIREART